ncbi:MAG: hypothetical protein M1294_06660 [Firmicutes bacterium]|nr:hypothetical protein [Bacillota bacterium]MCL5014999.1 hypothetical protein [Bacillota bacterium]
MRKRASALAQNAPLAAGKNSLGAGSWDLIGAMPPIRQQAVRNSSWAAVGEP